MIGEIILGEINLEQNIYICRLFKYNFSFEPYLLYLSEEKRKLLTKFRISAHKLEIEQGRYHKLPIANRICGICKAEVGDAIHFLLQCATLNKTRSNFIKDISDKFPNFSKLDTKSQFIWLMSSEDKILIQKVSSLLHSLNEERNSILNK
jgi:hypothetical protein